MGGSSGLAQLGPLQSVFSQKCNKFLLRRKRRVLPQIRCCWQVVWLTSILIIGAACVMMIGLNAISTRPWGHPLNLFTCICVREAIVPVNISLPAVYDDPSHHTKKTSRRNMCGNFPDPSPLSYFFTIAKFLVAATGHLRGQQSPRW